MLEMLRVEPWLRFPLTLNFTSSAHSALRLGAPPPPPHVAVLTAPLEVGLPLGYKVATEETPPACMNLPLFTYMLLQFFLYILTIAHT